MRGFTALNRTGLASETDSDGGVVTPLVRGQDAQGRIATLSTSLHREAPGQPLNPLFDAPGTGEAESPGFSVRRKPKKTLNPWRLWRRRQRLKRDALEEAQHLRRWHGEQAVAVAREKLARPGRTSWGRNVLVDAIKLLQARRI